jgi:ribosomal protein S18 acetylase RimI-like enzyme
VQPLFSTQYAFNMINFETSNSRRDLQGILDLQTRNLAKNLSFEEINREGFVTVSHTIEQLKHLNKIEKHIIAKDEEKIIGYLLAMTAKSKSDIPVLIPMFDAFDKVWYDGKVVADYNYIVIGQACVDKAYRGQGIFDRCYEAFRKRYQNKYQFAITEIAATNIRSQNAHRRIGFKELCRYTSFDGLSWVVVVWKWEGTEG